MSEVCKHNREAYPPKTIHQILAGLQRYMLEKNPTAPKFLDLKHSCFRDVHGACHFVYRELHQQGIGTSVRHAYVNHCQGRGKTVVVWSNCITWPRSLQRAIFFYIGKRICIREGKEQRHLGPSQLVRLYNPDCCTYIEHGSKNRTEGLRQLSLENKMSLALLYQKTIPNA